MTNPLFDQLFGKHAASSRTFLQEADGAAISYGNFLQSAGRLAHALTQIGVQPGDRLAVQVAKSPEALALYAACVQAGVVFLPLNPAYTTDELCYFIEDSAAAAIICDEQSKRALSAFATASGTRIETLNADGTGTLMERAAMMPADFTPVSRSEGDLAALLYTSGTTGRSKGAMLSQGNLLSNATTLADAWRFDAQDSLLHALPIFHTHGLFVATNVSLMVGSSMIFLPRFDLDELIAWMPHATTLMGVPTFYTRLLDDPRFTRELVSHMRLFVSGSAPLLAETHTAFEARTGHRILERYGMTETNMNTSNPYEGERRAGTVGFPLPRVELCITDPATGDALPKGDIGQIEVRGPNVFQGYWQMPEKTAEELRANGFFITGDLGQLDDDGYLRIVGRNKDLIISGGYNIYPKEIELVLDEQPGIRESAVIGVPDKDFGESVLGVLVAEPGHSPDPDQMMATIRHVLARFKHPRKLVFVDALPRNTMGKVQKNILRDRFKEALDPG